MQLKINNLSYRYNTRDTFYYTDYIFHKGLTIINAPSGKGKSTLFSLFIYSIKPYSGTVFWKEKNIEAYEKLIYLDSEVSIVFQGAVLSYYFTLHEYINLLLLNRAHVSTTELADFYLDILGLRFLLHEDIKNCSGGEKYKISLFLALLKNTPLLLLDEPTAHLDTSSSLILIQLLKNIRDKVVLVITHDQLFFDKNLNCNYYYL